MPSQGEIIVFEGGAYSGSYIAGPFRALCDFSLKEAFKASGIDAEDTIGDPNEFISFLNRNNYIEDIEYRTFYLEDFGDWEMDDWD